MATQVSGEASLEEQVSNSIDKSVSSSQSRVDEPTSNGKTGEAASPPIVSPTTVASTFKALAAVSYAERIRTSSPSVDHVVASSKPAAGIEESSSTNGKSNGTDAKSNSGKRTGKNKSAPAGTHVRGSASRSAAVSDATTPLGASQGSESADGKQETAAEPRNDGDQGWQEVTTKFKNHHNSKPEKKDGNSGSGSGRHKQHGKKAAVSGGVSDESVVQEKTAKGKTVSSGRKDKEKGDKEPRQQPPTGEDAMPIEPTRRQQQQQKEKDGVSPKALGMKSASWRSSPLSFHAIAAEDGLQNVGSSSATQDEENRSPISQDAPEASTKPAVQPVDSANAQESSAALATANKMLDAESASIPAAATPTQTPSQSTPPAPAINIWQLRKEKMKSSTTKPSKAGGNAGNTSKTVFSSLTDATSPPLSANISGKKAGTNKAEDAQGKRPVSVPGASATTPVSAPAAGKNITNKSNVKASAESVPAPISSGRRDISTPTIAPGAGSQAVSGSSTRLADDKLWPDIATLATKNLGTTGKEGKKKEREDEEAARPTTTSGKKEKKKWTPIPPAEMQEALDRAEKARKAASSAVAEGGKQKRRNSAAAGADDGSQGLAKNSVKKNPQGQNKAAGKAGQGSSSGTPETTSKKGKAAAAAGKQVTSSKLSPGELAGDKSANGIVAAIDGGIVNPSNVEDPLQANGRPLIDAQPAAPAADQSESHDLPETVDSEGITSSLLSTDDAAGVKRKTPVPDRQKGQPNMSAGRQGGISGSASSNHHPQARDLGRGGAATGRGGRGHGGKASRNGNASSSKYSDSGMSLSPRGSAKPGLLSPPGGYQGLPYETSMAAAVNAPGFVPFGSQFSHPFYPRGYHYGSNSHAGVSSSGSDSGGYDFTPNVQQGGQQPYMPYNMAFMPQQRPVTEIPGLDSLRYYILGQIEYYFSIHNLCMDQFLKEQMDSHGWVDIPMIASFNRIRQVTTDEALVKEVAQLSHLLELRENKMRLRDNWQVWVFPNARPSIFPEPENTSATRLEELAMHGVRVSDLSEETRERIVGDIQRDILRSKSGPASKPQATVPAAGTDISTVPSVNGVVDDETAKATPATSIASDSSSDKLDIIL